jgi:hypothetical protein
MNRSFLAFILAVGCLAAPSALGQSFDCQALGAFPAIGGAGDCEGVTSNNLGAGTGVTNSAQCGFPTSGTQFARLTANGPILGSGVGQPAGAPVARPLAAVVTEVRVPVPAGATSVGVCYNFYRGEGANQATYNDGLEIAIVDSTGATVLVSIAHVDTFSVMAPGVCGPTYPEAGIDGPESGSASFPGGVPAGAYLSIACWNSGDNAVASYSTIDSILWNTAPVCPYTPPTPPVNDNCAASIVVGLGTNPAPAASGFTYTNDAATNPVGYPAVCGSINKDVWFNFTPATSGIYQIDNETPAGFAVGTNTNTTLAVYPAGCVAGAALGCDADSGVTGTGLMPLLLINLNAGSSYDIRVGSVSTTLTGTFYLNVNYVGPASPNDECTGAIPLSMGTNPTPAASGNTFNNVGMTTSAGYPAICATILNDVWFSFTPATSGTYVFDTNTPCGFTAGTMLNTTIALYAAASCGTPGAALACDADSGFGSLSLLQAALTAGTTYHLRVGSTSTLPQSFYVNVRQGPLVTNDTCATPINVGLGINPAPAASCNFFTNDTATSDTLGYPAVCGTIANDVWFTFTPPVSGDYRIDTETPAGFAVGSNTNTTVAVYNSCAVGPAIVCDTDAGVTGTGLMSIVNANGLSAGVPIYIRVGSTSTTGTGTFYLSINRIFSIAFSSPFGPGSLQFDVVAGPPNGSYYLPITFNAGAFPNGWLYGVDIFLQEILDELATGYPFVGPLNANGDATFGPIGGVPSGLVFYSVGLGFPGPVIDYPTANTAPKTYTVP